MVKKTITYTDYNGDIRTEDFYFNISKLEINRAEIDAEHSLSSTLKHAAETKNARELMECCELLIRMGYGIKSPDGKKFTKSDELTEEFISSPAYEQLFFELMSDPDSFAMFIKAVLPPIPQNA